MNGDLIAAVLIAASACVMLAGHLYRTGLRRRFRETIAKRYSGERS